jgi:hypothetical protein
MLQGHLTCYRSNLNVTGAPDDMLLYVCLSRITRNTQFVEGLLIFTGSSHVTGTTQWVTRVLQWLQGVLAI